MSAPGRPKRELLGLREDLDCGLRGGVGRRPRSQTRPSGLGCALLTLASLGGTARSAKGAPISHRRDAHLASKGPTACSAP